MPERLLERYHEGLEDPELIGLRSNIALLDARLEDLLSRVDTGESGELWMRMRKAWKDCERARRGGHEGKIVEAEYALSDAIAEGERDATAWAEVRSLLEQRRKLADTERRRLLDMEQMVRVDEATAAIMAVVQCVREEVKDKDVIARISARVATILAGTRPRRS